MGQAYAVGQPLPAVPAVPSRHTKVTLYDDAVSDYLAEITPTLKTTTVYKYKKSFEFFRNYFSNVDINSYSKEDIKTFKNKMLAEKKVPHTINGFLGCLKGLFDYSIKNGLRMEQVNPVEGMYIKNSKKRLKARDQFYEGDLKTIFDWNTYKNFANKPDYFWGPPICLYSVDLSR